MRVFICVLVLCGAYSSHAASVGFAESSPCANQDDGALLPVIGECSEFFMCLKGETLKSSCGSALHFDPVGRKCIEITRSLCVSGKKEVDAKPQKVLVRVEAKPQGEGLKLEGLKPEGLKPKPEEPRPQQAQPELKIKPEESQIVLAQFEVQPKPEELQPQLFLSEKKQTPGEPMPQQAQPELKINPEEPKLQLTQSEIKAKPVEPKPLEAQSEPKIKPDEPKLQLTQSEIKAKPVETKPLGTQSEPKIKPEEPKPLEAQSEPKIKPEEPKPLEAQSEPKIKPEEPKLQLTQSEIKAKPVEPKPLEEQAEPKIKPEEPKPLEAQSEPKIKPEEPKPEEAKPQQTHSEPQLQSEDATSQREVPLSDLCLNKAIGSFVVSKTNCNQYYVCLGNRHVTKSCPPELHFNAELGSCTSPEMANCLVEPESDAATQTQVEDNSAADEKAQEPIETEETKPAPETVAASFDDLCAGQAYGAFIPIPGSCSDYAICLEGDFFELSCGKQHFDPVYRACISKETSACVEEKAVLKAAEEANFIGDVYLGSGNDGVVVGNANIEINNTGVVSNVNLVSSSSGVAVGNTDLGYNNKYDVSISSTPGQNKSAAVVAASAGSADIKISSLNVGNTDLGQNNSGITVGNANVNINNTGSVSNANIILASQNVEVGNTDLGSWNSYVVNGSSVVINNKTVPLKQSGLPVNKHAEQVDIDVSSSGVLLKAQGVAEAASNETDVGNTNLGQGNSGIAISNANIKISNSGTVKDVNLVSGVQNSVVGNTDLGSFNSVAVNGADISAAVSKENKEVVVATVDSESASLCVGVPSGTFFAKVGSCEQFLTCEDGVAYTAACPKGLHFNAQSNVCDWPEQAGCA